MDLFAEFVSECCTIEAGAFVTKGDLRTVYEKWSQENGVHHPLGVKDVKARLAARGITERRVGGARLWVGIRLPRAGEVRDVSDTSDASHPFSETFPHEHTKEGVPDLEWQASPASPDPDDDLEREAIQTEGHDR